MTDWFSNVYKGFIITSVIAFIIAVFTQGSTSIGAYLAGYLTLIIAIMLILLILFNKFFSSTQEQSFFKNFIGIVMTSLPFLIMFGFISFMYYLLSTYKEKIVNGQISPGFNSFNNIGIMLLLIQLYIVYNIIISKNFQESGVFPKLTRNFLLLLGILSIICSFIIYTILKYYSTDGFTLN
jgi:hypothetical protein